MSRYRERSLQYHRQIKGKIEVNPKARVKTLDDLSLAYTPGVADVCRALAADPSLAYELTVKSNAVAVVTDGSAVLGLGNIGPEAAMPVMEGKALLMKQFGDVDAWPLCLNTQDSDEIIAIVRAIAPGFGAINLEDIAAPRCFEIERGLQDLGIPVLHDDQHGTAMVTLAALINAARVLGRDLSEMRVVVCGAGAAGMAIAELLACPKYCEENGGQRYAREVILCDSKGILSSSRSDLTSAKWDALHWTNPDDLSGSLQNALEGSDVFIGVSRGDLLVQAEIERMNAGAIVMALSNPTPEILPEEAFRGGAALVATGRSDLPNQVNNVLIFPGFLRGLLDARAPRMQPAMWFAAAHALADSLPHPTRECILPGALQSGREVAHLVAAAVRRCAEAYENSDACCRLS